MKTDERNKFAIKSFLGEYLDLRKDKDNELATVDSIRKGVEFKGANLWILIFAIFMASLGLNVNSTAVIIGAMLISPLMGPIMGVGLSVGLNDFELMKRSLKSFLITTAFSVTTATIFFLLAPIAGSQSELLDLHLRKALCPVLSDIPASWYNHCVLFRWHRCALKSALT